MKRLICWWRGAHRWHPDPGDIVLYCTTCHYMVDLYDELRRRP